MVTGSADQARAALLSSVSRMFTLSALFPWSPRGSGSSPLAIISYLNCILSSPFIIILVGLARLQWGTSCL